MIQRPVATLSGGEKARLVLALIALTRPAILVLDEPTNHLDLDMRDALAFALQDYAGAVVIVSHDRVLLDKTVDDFWVLENHTLSVFRGDLNDYTTARKNNLDASGLSGRATVDDNGSASGNHQSRKVQRQDRARHRESVRHLRNAVQRLERDMDKQGEQLQLLEARLADTQTYQAMPAEELDGLLAEAGKLRTSLQQTEEAWLQAAAELEAAQETP